MDKNTLNNIIGKMGKKELINLINEMIMLNGAAEQTLLNYCEKKSTEDNRNLIFERQLVQYWNNAYHTIDQANECGGCSERDEDDACYEIEKMTELVKENDLSWNCRKGVLDEMLKQALYDNSGFTDCLMESAYEFCKNDDENEYLADFLKERGDYYFKGIAASIYSELGNDDKFLDIKLANLEYSSDYLQVADYYMRQGEEELALNMLWEGFDKSRGRMDNIYKYLFKIYEARKDEKSILKLHKMALKKDRDQDSITELMYGFYKKKDDYENLKKMLLLMIQLCEMTDIVKWYEKCRTELTIEDWEENEVKILLSVKEKNLNVYLDICLEKSNNTEVLKLIKDKTRYDSWNNIDYNHEYSRLLIEYYPDEILEMYWKEAAWYIEKGKEMNYRHAAGVLQDIRSIYERNNRIDEWNKKFNELKEIHKRKKLLMKAIVSEELV